MGITASSYTLFPDTISCGGEVEGILSLSAGPDIVSNPADIVMVLDCSGSMEGEPFAAMKASVKTFIDIIDESTDENQDGNIGGGSQIAIVSFARTATQQTGFLTNTADLKTAVNNLTIDGDTNHEDAFTKAYSLFDPDTTHQKIMVMFPLCPSPHWQKKTALSFTALCSKTSLAPMYQLHPFGSLRPSHPSFPLPLPQQNWKKSLPNWLPTFPIPAQQKSSCKDLCLTTLS